jgi:hypothetical protein
MIDPQNQEWWFTTILMMLLSTWAGFVSYLRVLVNGAKFRVVAFLSHLSSGALAGLVTALLCDQYALSIQWTGVACAISGHMGAEAIKVFEAKFKQRAEDVL